MSTKTKVFGGIIVAAIIATFVMIKLFDEPPKKVPVTAPVAPPPVVVSVPKGPTLTERLALATVRKGEGIEHSLIRQLVADPTSVSDPKEKFTGDLADPKAVKQWAGKEAHVIATRAGYFDWKFGAEIRVVRPDEMAFLIEKSVDGKLYVAEYKAAQSDEGFGVSPAPVETYQLAETVPQSSFQGWPETKHVVPTYEYLYTGASGLPVEVLRDLGHIVP